MKKMPPVAIILCAFMTPKIVIGMLVMAHKADLLKCLIVNMNVFVAEIIAPLARSADSQW